MKQRTLKPTLMRTSIILGSLLAATSVLAQSEFGIPWRADAFRAGEKAYVVGAPTPLGAFDYVTNVNVAPGSSGWALVTHRRRTPEDAMTNPPRPVERQLSYSLFNLATGKVHHLKDGFLPTMPGVTMTHAAGDIVVFGTVGAIFASDRQTKQIAYDCRTSRTLDLPENEDAWVLNDQEILTTFEGRFWIMNWNGERKSLTSEVAENTVTLTPNPSQFVVMSSTGSGRPQWLLLDAKAQTVTPISMEEAASRSLPGARPLQVRQEADSEIATTFSAWIEGRNQKAPQARGSVLTAQASSDTRLPHELDSSARIAADMRSSSLYALVGTTYDATNQPNAAWFVRNEQLYVRRISELPLSDYEAYVRGTVQLNAMNRAKMVAVAAMLFSADHDGATPENKGWQDALRSYLRDPSAMDGIVYLGDGKLRNEIENPSSTFMGFLDTPYGRVNMAWDGSARWVPKPAP